ncbi:MAG: hypothetical protein ABEJ04_05590 [Halobacteriaceae archaeon]
MDDADLRRRSEEAPGEVTAEDVRRVVADDGVTRDVAISLNVLAERAPETAAAVVEAFADAPDRQGLEVLAAVSNADPDLVAPVAPAVRDALDGDAPEVALAVLASLAADRPEAVTPATERLGRFLTDGYAFEREPAVECCLDLAASAPESLVSIVPALLEVADAEPLETDADIGVDDRELREEVRQQMTSAAMGRNLERANAAAAVEAAANADPEAVRPHAERLAELGTGSDSGPVRAFSLGALAAVAGADPEAARPALDGVAAVLATDEDEVARGKAARVLAAVADADPEAVAAVVSDVAPAADLLAADLAQTRGAGAALLSYLAEVRPEDVAAHAPVLRERAGDADEETYVRGSAVWALMYADPAANREFVRGLAESDPDGDVRAAAAEALELAA